MKVLVLNAGSSSIKYQLFNMETADAKVISKGLIEQIGEAAGRIVHTIDSGYGAQEFNEATPIADHNVGLQKMANYLMHDTYGVIHHPKEIIAVGHRVVHGGEQFSEPTLITEEVKEQIKALIPLAPLHNPANLQGIEEAEKIFPEAKQIAVFDTAFHQSLPDYAYRYAIPNELYEKHHIRVYGFHGTSHQYVSRKAAEHIGLAPSAANLITIHLGNGCSITAVKKGQSVDTSLGLTPLPGLMMGTRSGDIDPAIIFFLQRNANMDSEQIDKLLNKQSGLKGIAGNNDMRAVAEAAGKGDASAQLAIELFAYRIRKYIGSYMAALGKVDAIVFTGGIGENDTQMREKVCAGLEIFGIALDAGANANARGPVADLHTPEATVKILKVATNEELEIAQQAKKYLS